MKPLCIFCLLALLVYEVFNLKTDILQRLKDFEGKRPYRHERPIYSKNKLAKRLQRVKDTIDMKDLNSRTLQDLKTLKIKRPKRQKKNKNFDSENF